MTGPRTLALLRTSEKKSQTRCDFSEKVGISGSERERVSKCSQVSEFTVAPPPSPSVLG